VIHTELLANPKNALTPSEKFYVDSTGKRPPTPYKHVLISTFGAFNPRPEPRTRSSGGLNISLRVSAWAWSIYSTKPVQNKGRGLPASEHLFYAWMSNFYPLYTTNFAHPFYGYTVRLNGSVDLVHPCSLPRRPFPSTPCLLRSTFADFSP
jgi:hypothetical protein